MDELQKSICTIRYAQPMTRIYAGQSCLFSKNVLCEYFKLHSSQLDMSKQPVPTVSATNPAGAEHSCVFGSKFSAQHVPFMSYEVNTQV